MAERADLLRIDSTGTVHPVGRTASQELRARVGEWRLSQGPKDAIFLRQEGNPDAAHLKLAGEVRSPGALYDIVSMIAQSAWSGELMIFSEESVRSIFFDRGDVVGATTNVADERLGETLYRFGVVTRDQLQAMLDSAKASGKRLGETAIELEFVTAKELFPMMARQVEEVFYAALHVSEGHFYFFDRFDERRVVRRHDLNASALLMDGARRMDEMRYFREKVPNDTFVPVPYEKAAGKKPPDDVAEVFAQCDGKRDVAEIGRRLGLLEFEITRAVFQLVSGGFLHVVAPRPQGAEAIVGTFNPALAVVHAACDAGGKGEEFRHELSMFALSTGVYLPLFQGAGPLPDGTLKADRVAKNLGALAGDEPDSWLIQQLHEYAGFALFQAGSLLSREQESSLNASVAEILKPLRQGETGVPNSRRP